jgi:hypothetical protein
MADRPGVGVYNGAGGYGSRNEVLAGGGLAGSLNGSAAAASAQNLVFMGPMFAKTKDQPYYGSTTTAQSANQNQWRQTMWTTDQAKAYYYTMDPGLKERVARATFAAAGYKTKNLKWHQSEYEKAVDQASYETQLYGSLVSVWDVLDRWEAQAQQLFGPAGGSGGGGGGGGGGGAYAGPVVKLTNPSDAQALVDSALQQALGRDAHPGERKKFLELLNQAEVENPYVSEPGVQGGGLNAQQAAKEFAMSRKDSAEFMVNTQYMDWFMDKITRDETEGIASGL